MSPASVGASRPAGERPAKRELALPLWFIWAGICGVIVLFLFVRSFNLFGRGAQEVVAYCAQDQVYAETVFQEFQQATGIKVQAVYDSEAVKTVGLANRLLAERGHPQCDCYWGNEEMRARQLEQQGVWRPTNGCVAFGYRSRRMVINTNLVPLGSAPASLLDLTNAVWNGKVALAYPQFGTTATHFHVLRQHWGEPLWLGWCRALKANKPLLVEGNSVVVQMVGSGQAWIGLTDSDDIAAGQREGLPIEPLAVNEETLLIPNTVAVVRAAPHPATAQRLFEYLQQPAITESLIRADALEGTSEAEVATRTLKVDWGSLLRDLESTTSQLNEIFLK